MKKHILYFLLLAWTISLSAQNADWIQQSPPNTNSLYDVEILSPGVIVAVGENGTIIKSPDGGQTWQKKKSTIYNNLNSVYFINSSTGFAVGTGGTILKTTDSGETWISQTSSTGIPLYSVCFVNPEIGWVSGYNRTVLKTTDGGITWISQYSTSSLTFLEELTSIDQQKVMIAGWGSEGDFYKTTDGGLNWKGSDLQGWCKGVDFITESTGWIAGITASYISVTESWGDIYKTILGKKATIWKTTNGGETWTPFIFEFDKWLNDITFIDSNNGFAVGEKGLIIYTTDGGLNWFSQNDPKYASTSFNSVSFESPTTGYIVGDKGTILKTIDGGTTWNLLGNSGTTNYLRSISFVSESIGWATGEDGTIAKTIDGGKNWIAQSSGVKNMLFSIYFTDSLNGWCTGESGKVLHTTDGGSTWVNQTSGVTDWLYSIYFTDKNNGWAVGNNGNIIHTSNGGSTWNEQTSPTTSSLNTVFFINSTTGWAAGYNGIILRTTNGGQIWSETKITNSEDESNVKDIFFIDNNTGWCIGDWIMKTTNGGQTWVKQFGNMSEFYNYYRLNSIFFTDAQTGYISAEEGKVLKTTNGGTTWCITSIGNDVSYYDIHFENSLTGWVAGYNGYIMKTNNGGGTFLPMEYLSIPTLSDPNDGRYYLDFKQTLKWYSAGEGCLYQIQVITDDIHYNDSIVFDIMNVSDTSLVIENLSPNTFYYWKVRLINNNEIKGNWSKQFSFKTHEIPDCTPTLSSPWYSTETDYCEAYLYWHCAYAEEFHVQVSSDPTFSTGLVVDTIVNTDNMKVLLDYNSNFYWRVKQIWKDLPSEWSEYSALNTPEKKVFIYINKPYARESLLKGTIYHLEWDDNITSELQVLLYNNSTLVYEIGNTSSNSFDWLILPSLEAGNNYQIVLNDPAGGFSKYSDYFSIENPQLYFYDPNIFTSWIAGSNNNVIEWFDDFSGNLLILLYKGGVFTDTIGYTENEVQTHFNWNISSLLLSGSDYQIIITDTIYHFSATSNYFTILNPSSINNYQDVKSDFLIYPNPGKNIISLEFNHLQIGLTELELYSIDGRMVMKKKLLLQKNEIDISLLQRGTYIVEIKNDNSKYFKKLIKN